RQGRRQLRFRKSLIEPAVENVKHDDSQKRDGEKPGCSRDRVVHARCDPGAVLRYRIHYRGGQRRDRDRHSKTEKKNRRKKFCPITAADVRQREKSVSKCCDQWSDNQRQFRSVTYDESTRQARQK